MGSSSLDFAVATKDSDSNGIYSLLSRPNYHQRCIEAFFQYFYDAHPFLPPRQQLLQLLKGGAMDHLQTAMCYVGSRYVSGAPTESFELNLKSYLLPTSVAPKDASVVQAMLLFALGLDGNNDQKRAIEILIKAQSLAIELGMDQSDYSMVNGRGLPIFEESLRRTWWELYVVCIMLAGFHGREKFHTNSPVLSVPLPCEEKEFTSGCIPPLRTLEQFDDDLFADEDIAWSSYAYRIKAARNLERILNSDQIIFPDDPALQRQETYLTSWNLQLPENKRVFFDQYGTFDEMLFQAHMISNVSSIILYRHFSPLDGLAVRTITSCTRHPGVTMGSMADSIHTRRTTQAASNISKLITIPTALAKHTHFFVCALTLSSITHLSLWSSLPVMAPDQDLKQRIRMNAGALKAVASVWPSAELGYRQVTSVTEKIFMYRKEAVGEVFWNDFIEEGFMSGVIEDTADVDS